MSHHRKLRAILAAVTLSLAVLAAHADEIREPEVMLDDLYMTEAPFTHITPFTRKDAENAAAGLHASLFGKALPETESAVENTLSALGLARTGEDAPVTLGEFAKFVHAACMERLPVVNEVSAAPGMSEYDEAARHAVTALYVSGAYVGDERHIAHPEMPLTRHEAAAMLMRLSGAAKPLTVEKGDVPQTLTAARYFADDTGEMPLAATGTYGWEYDPRGLPAGSLPKTMTVLDVSDRESTRMIRRFDKLSEGKLTLETIFEINDASDGFEAVLSDGENGDEVMCFVTRGGYWCARVGDTCTETDVKVTSGTTFKTVTDFDVKTNTLYIDGRYIGAFPFADNASAADTLVFRGTESGKVSVTPRKTKLYTGYAFNDIFLAASERDTLGDMWEITGGSAAVRKIASNAFDACSAVLTAQSGKTAEAKASVTPVYGKTVFEMKYYCPDIPNGTSFAFGDYHVTVRNGKCYADDGTYLRDIDTNVWQTVRLTVDPFHGAVAYSLDRKVLYTRDTDVTLPEHVCITLPGGSLTFDDVFVFASFDDAGDYVDAPQPIESDTIVGVEVCDIWRNGYQFGWDYTSSFDELTPVLGRYDEGSTEVADYEIKYLTEHGVDYTLVCWYGGTPSAPLKTPRNNSGLAARLDAKYTDYLKYAIMWENSSNLPKNAAEFRAYVVPYWKEYYLYDHDRYMTVDNKALITIYRGAALKDIFGSAAGVKTELDYLRQVCKELGYDGAVILTCGGNISADAANELKQMGFDGVYAYNWGQAGRVGQTQINYLSSQSASASSVGFTSVPTVGVGFCNMYLMQGNHRTELITLKEYADVLRYVKNTLLAGRSGESWQNNMVILSNWNEYGEGHYLFPTEKFGFSYLDTIRDVFTSGGAHTDVVPTAEAKKRFTALYPQDLLRIRTHETVPAGEITIEGANLIKEYDFSKAADRKVFGNTFGTSRTETSTAIAGVSRGADFGLLSSEISIDTASAPFLALRMKLTAPSGVDNVQLYFLTESDTEYDEVKAVYHEVKTDGVYRTYVLDMSRCAAWKGTVTELRIDPISRGDCTWEIASVAFYSPADTTKDGLLNVNYGDATVVTLKGPRGDNGTLAAAVDPNADGSIFTRLGLYYTFDKEHFNVYAPAKLGEDGQPLPNVSYDGARVSTFTRMCLVVDDIGESGVTMHSTSNGRRHDPAITLPSMCFDADEVTAVTVRMRYNITDGSDAIDSTLFFRAPSGAFDGDHILRVHTNGASSEEAVDITFDTASSPLWNDMGTVAGLRFDPFEAEGTLTVEAISFTVRHPSISFTFGSDTASDALGASVKLTTPAVLYDGVPYIDLSAFADTLGLTLTRETDGLVTLDHPNLPASAAADGDTVFRFGTPGYLDGLTTSCLTLTNHAPGAATFTSFSNGNRHDPTLTTPTLSFDASACRYISVKLAYTMNSASSISATMFFAAPDEAFTAEKSVSVTRSGRSSNGMIELVFDMTKNEYWTGEIARLRFDPFEAAGSFTIYEWRLRALPPTSCTVLPGQRLSPGVKVKAENAALETVSDPDDAYGICYKVTPTAAARRWSYLVVGMRFEAGRTYTLRYRIYPLKTALGADYADNTFGGAFRFGTDGSTVKDHAVGSCRLSSDSGWTTVETTYTVPEDYVGSSSDAFVLWSNPLNDVAVGYLADDIEVIASRN